MGEKMNLENALVATITVSSVLGLILLLAFLGVEVIQIVSNYFDIPIIYVTVYAFVSVFVLVFFLQMVFFVYKLLEGSK